MHFITILSGTLYFLITQTFLAFHRLSGAQQQRHHRWNAQLGAPVTQKVFRCWALVVATVLHICPECFAVVKRRRRKYRKMPLEERQEDRGHCPCDHGCVAVLEMHGEKQRCRQSGTISLKLAAQHHIKASSRSMFVPDRLRADSCQKFPMSTGWPQLQACVAAVWRKAQH